MTPPPARRVAACIAVVALVATLTACSGPADVERRYREELARYDADMATAIEWNNHTLGIPASGWLVIVIVAVLVAGTLLVLAGVWTYRVVERRAANRHAIDKARHDVEKTRIERGRCTVCGADPQVDAPAKP